MKITVSWREVTQRVDTFEATFEVDKDKVREPLYANLEQYLRAYAIEDNRVGCSSLIPVREILDIEEQGG